MRDARRLTSYDDDPSHFSREFVHGSFISRRSSTAYLLYREIPESRHSESFFWYQVNNSVMIEYLVLLSCLGFLAFLIPGRHRKYAAIVGWTFIVLSLFANLADYFSENNFLYPLMAALSVPFLFITAKYLLTRRRAGHAPVPGCCGGIHHLCPVRAISLGLATGSSESLSARSSGYWTSSEFHRSPSR